MPKLGRSKRNTRETTTITNIEHCEWKYQHMYTWITNLHSILLVKCLHVSDYMAWQLHLNSNFMFYIQFHFFFLCCVYLFVCLLLLICVFCSMIMCVYMCVHWSITCIYEKLTSDRERKREKDSSTDQIIMTTTNNRLYFCVCFFRLVVEQSKMWIISENLLRIKEVKQRERRKIHMCIFVKSTLYGFNVFSIAEICICFPTWEDEK